MFTNGLLSFAGLGGTIRGCLTLDLSAGGVRVRLPKRIPHHTKVRVQIQLEKYKDTVDAAGVIRWCYQNRENAKQFFAGIMFTNLTDGEKRKIENMRSWFTSPHFKALRESRNRE